VETLFRQAAAPFGKLPATRAVADCYLVAFAEASGAHLVTFDRGLANTAKSRHVPVTRLEAV
jgi:predicted nucleic acid-binding protein